MVTQKIVTPVKRLCRTMVLVAASFSVRLGSRGISTEYAGNQGVCELQDSLCAGMTAMSIFRLLRLHQKFSAKKNTISKRLCWYVHEHSSGRKCGHVRQRQGFTVCTFGHGATGVLSRMLCKRRCSLTLPLPAIASRYAPLPASAHSLAMAICLYSVICIDTYYHLPYSRCVTTCPVTS